MLRRSCISITVVVVKRGVETSAAIPSSWFSGLVAAFKALLHPGDWRVRVGVWLETSAL